MRRAGHRNFPCLSDSKATKHLHSWQEAFHVSLTLPLPVGAFDGIILSKSVSTPNGLSHMTKSSGLIVCRILEAAVDSYFLGPYLATVSKVSATSRLMSPLAKSASSMVVSRSVSRGGSTLCKARSKSGFRSRPLCSIWIRARHFSLRNTLSF